MDKAHIQTDKQLEEMEKRLGEIYRRASAEIKDKWAAYLKGIEPKLSEAQKAYAAAKRTGNAEEIRKAEIELSRIEKNKILRDKHYKNLVEETAEQLAHVNESALAYINGELPKTYVRNFESVCDGIESAVSGYSFELVDKNTVKRLITEGDKTLLPKPSQKTLNKIEKSLKEGKDIRWNTRKINAEVLQGILQGDSMDKIAARMRRVTDMNATSAIRNARTMVTGAENAGRMDMLRQAREDGVVAKKKWIAAKDKRTRHWHLELDGVLKDEDEPFTNEYGDIMFPGDPAAHPANCYNCRCTMASVVIGFEKAQVQKAMEHQKVFREENYRAFETGEQTNDFFYYDDEKRGLMARKKSAHGQWTSGLSREEAKAIGDYCADGYYDINNYLRKYGDWQDINAERVKHQTEMLDGVIARYDLKESIKVYRAIQPVVFESYWDDIQSIVGTEYTDAGFMSTSPAKTSTALNKDCIMELFIPSGKGRGAYVNNVSGFQDEEYEFLLARDSKFRVIGAKETEDKLILKMEWIGNGQ